MLWHVSIFQNILKRTTPGSRDEDTATKAFNELKKVVIITLNDQLDECEYYHCWGTTAITMPTCVSLDHQRMQFQRAINEEDGGTHPPQQENPFWRKSVCSLCLYYHKHISYGASFSVMPVFISSLQIFPLISQSRWLVKHGELLEVDTQMMSISGSKLKLPTKPVYLHLFNDCLLLSRRKEWVISCPHTLNMIW